MPGFNKRIQIKQFRNISQNTEKDSNLQPILELEPLFELEPDLKLVLPHYCETFNFLKLRLEL